MDDEKDPNFIDGRNHQHALNYKGAIDAFERAVQSNPKNAAAHFELGLLYEEHENDFSSAIYHYEKHLKFRPNSTYREVVGNRIARCKLELAKTVSFGVINRDVHRDMQRMTNEIAALRSNIVYLQAQLAAKPPYITQYLTQTITNYVPTPVREGQSIQRPAAPEGANQRSRAQQSQRANSPAPRAAPNQAAAAPAAKRTYAVRPGDTLAEIARRHGISVAALQAANRGVDPRRLKQNQVLSIPEK